MNCQVVSDNKELICKSPATMRIASRLALEDVCLVVILSGEFRIFAFRNRNIECTQRDAKHGSVQHFSWRCIASKNVAEFYGYRLHKDDNRENNLESVL